MEAGEPSDVDEAAQTARRDRTSPASCNRGEGEAGQFTLVVYVCYVQANSHTMKDDRDLEISWHD